MEKEKPEKKQSKSSKKSSKKSPTQSAAAATNPSQLTKPKKDAAPTVEQLTPTPESEKSQEPKQVPKMETSEQQVAQKELEQIGKALGLDKLAEAVNNIGQTVKENRETINQLVGNTGKGKKEDGDFMSGIDKILENPFVQGLMDAAKEYFLGGEGNPKGKVNEQLMSRVVANYEKQQERIGVATDLMINNLTNGGKVFRDENGNIVVTKGETVGESSG